VSVPNNTGAGSPPAESLPPGAERPRRFRPKLRYELVGCGIHGHELVGTDLADIPDDYRLVAFDDGPGGTRWHRCLRCDSWLPLPAPESPNPRSAPPLRSIDVPLRGRPLRDRFVLRLIAVDRVVHFLALAAIAVAILLFAQHKTALQGDYTRILNRLQAGVGGPLSDTTHSGWLSDFDKLFAISTQHLYLYGIAVAAYAAINGIEAFGLWRARRWAEYLTLVEVVVLVPVEIHELTVRVSALKILTLVLNLAVVAYLLWSHRLFGVRGGGRADREEREADTGWPALERATPWLLDTDAHTETVASPTAVPKAEAGRAPEARG
jgi:uncharacterized membrane protein (DUF2068 family)